jgi:hypothetical protein
MYIRIIITLFPMCVCVLVRVAVCVSATLIHHGLHPPRQTTRPAPSGKMLESLATPPNRVHPVTPPPPIFSSTQCLLGNGGQRMKVRLASSAYRMRLHTPACVTLVPIGQRMATDQDATGLLGQSALSAVRAQCSFRRRAASLPPVHQRFLPTLCAAASAAVCPERSWCCAQRWGVAARKKKI